MKKLEAMYEAMIERNREKTDQDPIDFDTFSSLVKGKCYYCGQVGSNSTGYNGIDRVDNSKGYIEGNVVSCCKQCNRAKGTESAELFRKYIEGVRSGKSRWKASEFGSPMYTICANGFKIAESADLKEASVFIYSQVNKLVI